MTNRPSSNAKWLCESPVLSDVEAKLRRLLVELGNEDRILGIQVCAYKDGQVIIDTAAGVMGKDDPRPVLPDTLFPVFSATKGVTAGMIHWLADKGKLNLDEYVANIWPEFGTNGKDRIKVHHILNHTSGLHNALADLTKDDPMLFCDFDECVKRIATATPETEPGCEQLYHSRSYGWLCGGIIEQASGKKFQDVLEEAFVRPLNVEGEFYIGIPPGVESRLATLTYDTSGLNMFVALTATSGFRASMPSSFKPELLQSLIPLSNSLNVRRAIQPAGNGHFTARALARYYAALVDGGVVPLRHSSSKNQKDDNEINAKIFVNPKSKIHDSFLGSGDYKDLVFPNGKFGLGFRRVKTTDGLVIGLGHAGLGGSIGYGDVNNRFSVAVTLNKLFAGDLTGEIIRFVCSELNLPISEEYAGSQKFLEKPLIN